MIMPTKSKKVKEGGKYFTDTDSSRPKESKKTGVPAWAVKPVAKKKTPKKK